MAVSTEGQVSHICSPCTLDNGQRKADAKLNSYENKGEEPCAGLAGRVTKQRDPSFRASLTPSIIYYGRISDGKEREGGRGSCYEGRMDGCYAGIRNLRGKKPVSIQVSLGC